MRKSQHRKENTIAAVYLLTIAVAFVAWVSTTFILPSPRDFTPDSGINHDRYERPETPIKE